MLALVWGGAAYRGVFGVVPPHFPHNRNLHTPRIEAARPDSGRAAFVRGDGGKLDTAGADDVTDAFQSVHCVVCVRAQLLRVADDRAHIFDSELAEVKLFPIGPLLE